MEINVIVDEETVRIENAETHDVLKIVSLEYPVSSVRFFVNDDEELAEYEF